MDGEDLTSLAVVKKGLTVLDVDDVGPLKVVDVVFIAFSGIRGGSMAA